VFNADGTVRWSKGTSCGSVVADLDMDGVPEIVTNAAAYHADGSVYWTRSSTCQFVAVANFDGDPFPEIVVSANGLALLDHTGVVKWGPIAPPGDGTS